MKELKVYILPYDLDVENVNDLTDGDFINFAKTDGEIYSIEDFQLCWNAGTVYSFNSDYSYLRIL